MPSRLAFLPLAVLIVASTAHAADPVVPAPASPTPASPTPASPTPASPTPATPTPATPTPVTSAPTVSPVTPAPPAHQELIYSGEATRILGRTVHDPAGDEVGRIVDVIIDDQGVPRAALIDFGGFMGVGNRRIAVAWRALKFLPAAQQHQIRLDMTADQIKETPDFKPAPRPDSPPVTMAAPPPAPGIPASGK